MTSSPRRFRFPRLFWLRDRHSVDDEFAHHIEMREAELRSGGMSAAEARAEARRQFGDALAAREYCEEVDAARQKRARLSLLADEVRQDLQYAFRQITRHQGFAVSTISVLALGLALFIAALGVADAYLMRGLPFPDADRIVMVRSGPTAEFPRNLPDLRDVDWRTPAREFDGVVSWDLDGFTIMGGDHPEFGDGAWVSPGYFNLFGVQPALGRAFDSTEYAGAARVAIISNGLWKRRFGGDSAVIGTSVRMFSIDRPGEHELVTIVGVLSGDAWHVNRFTDVIRPLTTPRQFTLARMKPGMTLQGAQNALNAAVLPQVPARDSAWSMSLVSLHDDYVMQAKPAILALIGGAALTLLIVVTNAAGMSAVRSAKRHGEFAVRAALGAGRGRIARQAVTESLVLTGFAAAIGIGLARLLMGAIGPAIEQRLGISVPGGRAFLEFDVRLAFFVASSVLVASFVTSWRAVRIHRTALNVNIRPGESAGVGRARFRNVMMGAQIAFTFALLTGAALMARSAWNVTHEPLGFEHRDVYVGAVLLPRSRFANDSARTRATNEMIEAVAQRPDVGVAAAVWPPPFYGGAPVVVRAEGGGAVSQLETRRTWVSPSYFTLMGVPQREGRVFAPQDVMTTEPVVIVGERFARAMWPDGNALGARVRLGNEETAPWRTVVGVVGDTRSSAEQVQPAEIYLPLAQSPVAFIGIAVKWKSGVAGNTTELKNALASVDETLALTNAQTLTSMVERQTVRPRSLSQLLLVFSAFGLLLSAIGLASALAHGVAQRRPELAVRLALGASPARLFAMVVRDAARLVSVAIIAGAALSVAVARALSAQLYGVTAGDPVTYVAIAGIVAGVAFISAIVPARRAASVDPARTLRAG
jgi:predicted permease